MNIKQKIKRVVRRLKGLLNLNDYWIMEDKVIVLSADALRIIDMYDFGTTAHDDFLVNITKNHRKIIMDELVKRDKSVRNYVAIAIFFCPCGFCNCTSKIVPDPLLLDFSIAW
jgi:hypothetical protein